MHFTSAIKYHLKETKMSKHKKTGDHLITGRLNFIFG